MVLHVSLSHYLPFSVRALFIVSKLTTSSSSQQCAGKLSNVPVCKDPTVTYGPLAGTAVAVPYKDLDEKLSSLTKALAEITGAPRSGGNSNPADSKATGAAAAVGISGFGTMVGAVVAVWGVAAIGGAGLLLL